MQGKATSTTVFDLGTELPQQHVNLEVDLSRQRTYGRWLLIGLVLLAALLFNVWQRNLADRNKGQTIKFEDQRAVEVARGRELQLEVLSLRSPERIEDLAMKLNLVLPGPDDTIYLQRAVAPPPASVVALKR
jgi:hypothetical protein